MDKFQEAELKRVAIDYWLQAAEIAVGTGHADFVAKHRPNDGADWRQIDAATAALRNELLSVQA